MRNSTIRQKFGECPLCGNGREVALTKGLCTSHYWLGVRMKSVNKVASREDQADDEDVATLKKDLDLIFSRWLRQSGADKDGICECFICGDKGHYSIMQAGHYVKRGNSFLRFDTRNVKINCKDCNEYKGGNYIQYAFKLEEQSPGITEYLVEEGNIVYKFTRQELKDLIAEYSRKLKLLQK
jgi:hypothetical protein